MKRKTSTSSSGPGARALEHAPDGHAEARAVGLARPLDLPSGAAQVSLEAEELGGLARPLHSLERDEHSTHVDDLRGLYVMLARRAHPNLRCSVRTLIPRILAAAVLSPPVSSRTRRM